MFRKNTLYIYTDGSSLPNPRKGGIGVRYIYLDNDENEVRIDHYQYGYQEASSNQMELLAVIEGLRHIYDQDIMINYNYIEIRTDSMYVVNNKNPAIYTWQKNGWCNSFGRPIENASLWKELIKELKKIQCRIEIIWIKGHSKDQDNKEVDKMAKKSAKEVLHSPLIQTKLRRKKSDQMTQRGSIQLKGQRVSIHIINDSFLKLQRLSKYRYEVISKNSEYYQKVDFIFSELHQLKSGHSYYVIFNTDSKNPRILHLMRELKKK